MEIIKSDKHMNSMISYSILISFSQESKSSLILYIQKKQYLILLQKKDL
jgi:hypothetical protein